MDRLSLHVALLLSLSCAMPGAVVSAQTTTCRTADDESALLVGYLGALVTSADTSDINLRSGIGLSAVDSTTVVLVTKKQTCDKAVQGMNAQLHTPNLTRIVHVVVVGTNYAVRDPGHPSGEHLPTMIFDRFFTFKGVVLAP
jgi:hypothetical protein